MSIAAVGIDGLLSWYFGYPVFLLFYFLPLIYDDYRNLVLYLLAIDLVTDSKLPLGTVGFCALTLFWILSWLQNFVRVNQVVLFKVAMILTSCIFFVLTCTINFLGLLLSFFAFVLSFLANINRYHTIQ